MTKSIYQIINNLAVINDNSFSWNIANFNRQFLVVVMWKKDQAIKLQIYEIKTLKKVYEWESEKNFFLLIIMEIVGVCHYIN